MEMLRIFLTASSRGEQATLVLETRNKTLNISMKNVDQTSAVQQTITNNLESLANSTTASSIWSPTTNVRGPRTGMAPSHLVDLQQGHQPRGLKTLDFPGSKE